MILSVVLFTLTRSNTGSADRYGRWKITMFFPGPPRICGSPLMSSCASIFPLIKTSQEIRVKQVNYFFLKRVDLVPDQQRLLETVHVDE